MPLTYNGVTVQHINYNGNALSNLYYDNVLVWGEQPAEFTGLCFTANTAGSTVELTRVGSPSIANTAYSRDGSTWITFTPSTTAGTNTITLTNIGDKVYFRNDITGDFTTSIYTKFVLSGSLSASGNINSMYSSTNFSELSTLSYKYCFARLFQGCTSLTTPPKLPAINLFERCYFAMFYGCTSLTIAPKLPALIMATSCYECMFGYCDALTIPPQLPATNLAVRCYTNMFEHCISMQYVPALMATTLENRCYEGMFANCTSLQISDTQTASAIKVFRIPALETFTNTTTYGQSSMFTGCLGIRSSDTISGAQGEHNTYYTQNEPIVPTPPPVTANPFCFTADDNMSVKFNKYGSSWINNPYLQYKIDDGSWADYTFGTDIALNAGQSVYWQGDNNSFSESENNYIYFELSYSSTPGDQKGTISGNIMSLVDSACASTEIPNDYCFAYLFGNCWGINIGEFEMPATTLKSYCYEMMFYSTGIKYSPVLPATTLAPHCYDYMFNESTLLKSPDLPATTLVEGCYKGMFHLCESLVELGKIYATTYAEACMQDMFCYCRQLKQIPAMLGTHFPANCCKYMYEGCDSLEMYTTSGGTHTTPYRLPDSGTGTASSGAFEEMFLCDTDIEDGTPAVNTTYYTNATIIRP